MLAFRRAEIVLAVAELGEKLARDTETVEQPLVPTPGPDVVEHGAGGVARFYRVGLATGQLEQEKAVDRAEADLAGSRALGEARDVGKQPGELRRREIRIDDEARGFRDIRAPPLLFQLIAMLRGAPVLPDDGVGERLAGGAVPHERRFALIGDADRFDRLRADLLEHGACRREHRLPDLLWIVLDLARRGIDLGERHLCRGANAGLFIEGDGAGACRALVDGEHEAAPVHGARPVWLRIQPQYSSLPPSVGSTRSAGSS